MTCSFVFQTALTETQRAIVSLGTVLALPAMDLQENQVSFIMLTRTREAGVLLRDAFRDVLAHAVQLFEEQSANRLGEAARQNSKDSLGGLHQEANEMGQLAAMVRKWRCECFIGGVPIENDRERIYSGRYDPTIEAATGGASSGGGICKLVVGTPGRISDLISEGTLNVRHVRSLAIDAADVLLKPELAMREVFFIKSRLPIRSQTTTFATANRWRWPGAAKIPGTSENVSVPTETESSDSPDYIFGLYGPQYQKICIRIPGDAPIAKMVRYPSLFFENPSCVYPVAIDASLPVAEVTKEVDEVQSRKKEDTPGGKPQEDGSSTSNNKSSRWMSKRTPQL